MSWLGRLFLLFVGVPLLELFILVQVGQLVGVWPTIGLVVLTGAAGATLARLEGLRTIWKVRSELAQGRLPGGALLDGLAILVGGALLLTPGILTDLVGFSFLLPPIRKVLMGRIRKSLERQLKSGSIRVTHVTGFPLDGASLWGRGSMEDDFADADQTGQDPFFRESKNPDPSGEIVIEAEEPDNP
jgi:UPF0716 protein FxsA